MGMMQAIIDDSKTMEAEAVRGEEEAQADYEAFVKDSDAAIEAKTKDITSKSDSKAKNEGEKVQSETSMESLMGELQTLANQNADLHKECDFVLKNFEIRQGAR